MNFEMSLAMKKAIENEEVLGVCMEIYKVTIESYFMGLIKKKYENNG